MVRTRGLEPPHREAPDPKSGVSTNSTTSAFVNIIKFRSCDQVLYLNSCHFFFAKLRKSFSDIASSVENGLRSFSF